MQSWVLVDSSNGCRTCTIVVEYEVVDLHTGDNHQRDPLELHLEWLPKDAKTIHLSRVMNEMQPGERN